MLGIALLSFQDQRKSNKLMFYKQDSFILFMVYCVMIKISYVGYMY